MLFRSVVITWDGLPDRQWEGVVEQSAEQVISMNNRTVGHVLCSIEGKTEELKDLIPNLNVKIEITTARKADAIVVPRSAVFNQSGKQSVILFDGKNAITRPVTSGFVTTEEIEILQGIDEGDPVAINPLDVSR